MKQDSTKTQQPLENSTDNPEVWRDEHYLEQLMDDLRGETYEIEEAWRGIISRDSKEEDYFGLSGDILANVQIVRAAVQRAKQHLRTYYGAEDIPIKIYLKP